MHRSSRIKKLTVSIALVFFLFSQAVIADDVSDVQKVLQEKLNLDIELLSWLVINHSSNMSMRPSDIENNTGSYYIMKELEKRGYLYVLKEKQKSETDLPTYCLYPTEKAYKIIVTAKVSSGWTPELVHKSIESAKASGKYSYITSEK